MREIITQPEIIERLPDEPVKWYHLACRYVLNGPRRSLLGLYNEVRQEQGLEPVQSAPGAWRDACRHWGWVGRAQSHDKERLVEESQYLEGLRAEFKQKRLDALVEHLEKVVEASRQLSPDDASYRDVSHGLRVCVGELRKEMGETEPRDKGIALQRILESLPHDVRVCLAVQLERKRS